MMQSATVQVGMGAVVAIPGWNRGAGVPFIYTSHFGGIGFRGLGKTSKDPQSDVSLGLIGNPEGSKLPLWIPERGTPGIPIPPYDLGCVW